MRTWLIAPMIAALVGLLPSTRTAAQSGGLEDLSAFPRATLEIVTAAHKQLHYDVWVADTPRREQKGLMFVHDLPASQGMLFPENPPRATSMWMKNTLIELDMVFIGPDHRILKITPRAVPQSLETIASGGAVVAVLELRGGEAEKQGLRRGDEVRWKQ